MNDELLKLIEILNQNITGLITAINQPKSILETILENGLLVLLASLGTIIITNLYNKSENRKNREFELKKTEREFESNISFKREEILINKYDSIIASFKSYRLEYHTFQNSILTTLSAGKNSDSDLKNQIEKLKKTYHDFLKLHTINIGSLKVDLALLNLNENKGIINKIESTMVNIFNIASQISEISLFNEIEIAFKLKNKECYDLLIEFMNVFSKKYLSLYKLSGEDLKNG